MLPAVMTMTTVPSSASAQVPDGKQDHARREPVGDDEACHCREVRNASEPGPAIPDLKVTDRCRTRSATGPNSTAPVPACTDPEPHPGDRDDRHISPFDRLAEYSRHRRLGAKSPRDLIQEFPAFRPGGLSCPFGVVHCLTPLSQG